MARVIAYNPKKRGREESSEPWMQPVRTAPGTLLRVVTSEWEGVRKCLKSTHRRLHDYNVADMLQSPDDERGEPAPEATRLDPRRLTPPSVKCLSALHDAAGHVLALCAARLGLRPRHGGDAHAGARWPAREESRDVAASHAADALRGLRSALKDLRATAHILHVVSGRPPKHRARAADRLVRRATDEAAAARDAVLRMRCAVMLEFSDA
ncbi:LOW QUALITY PROTEIN: hypothetical protein SETIT_3G363200v2 [Setaria italica]|uniref:Uncharacterized protein n=1 Tax=Setaria italica TaxID=4555 RepID=A0A368QMI6_SETIT|nr:LOW QUALITY PROTEIN: hypothetical protein SETIT_3G363200v2 [Setaria italica]